MKKSLLLFALMLCGTLLRGQSLHCGNSTMDSAFALAIWTVDHNTHDGILHAGAGYGGEWTRDASINSWLAASLLRPEVACRSLWSVTEDSLRISHQYWDKMLWAIAAWHHFEVTGDSLFLRRAYPCARRSMAELEEMCFDSAYGLFMGPAVFQDGIEAYPEPIFDPALWDQSYVLRHPHSDSIRCLSTNAMYAEAYRALAAMAPPDEADEYLAKRDRLEKQLLRHLYDRRHHRLLYLIDHRGTCHPYQEGLGVSLTLLGGHLSEREALQVLRHLEMSPYGLPSVAPSFPRNSEERPGRHNMMIWPHINAFYALACARNGLLDEFYRELDNMARLAMVNGGGNFYEIYTLEGVPSGGWQCGALWDKKEHQTWCATGYLALWLKGVFGLSAEAEGLRVDPLGMEDGGMCSLNGLQWRGCELSITVRGRRGDHRKTQVLLNGTPVEERDLRIRPGQGKVHLEITL